MKISVQISKTWQERQYEPFNIQLGVEEEVSTMDDVDKLMRAIAHDLQRTALTIYSERKENDS